MKLIDSRPNIVAGTSYAHLKECLLKIEKSGYLNNIVKLKHVDKEVSTIHIITVQMICIIITLYVLHLR